MKLRKSEGTVTETDSVSPRSNTSGWSGRSSYSRKRLVIRTRNRGCQKSASSSGRRLSIGDRYQCENCPLASEADGSSGTLGTALEQPPEPFYEERSTTTVRPFVRPKWPDETAKKKVQAKPGKHIHPCICDLSKRQRANIEHFLKDRRAAQLRYERRVHEIEEEIRLAEEAEQQRLREQEAEKEFYGDEYELDGSKRKRKKRSARRASMVSLGVKQVINWRKPPKLEVRYTRTSNLRAINSTYCKPRLQPLPEIRPVDVNCEKPDIPVRTTRTVELRLKFSRSLIENFQKNQVKFMTEKKQFATNSNLNTMSERKSPGKEEIEMDDLNKKPGGMDNVLDITDNQSTEEDEEFKLLRKKYYQVSKDIRMDAIDEEKQELEKSENSPKIKYYEGSKTDRIKLLDEIKRQMEDLASISKSKK